MSERRIVFSFGVVYQTPLETEVDQKMVADIIEKQKILDLIVSTSGIW